MNCDDFRAVYLAGQEGAAERQHLAGCAACQADQPALDGARRLVADSALWEDPDPKLEEQVVALITPDLPTAGKGRRWRGRVVAAAALVAAVLVVVLAWAVVQSPRPDWKVPITGTAQAPGASGVVEGWNSPAGTRVVLTAEGLPQAPSGSVYEFWFSRDSVHVSAGTFKAAGKVELWVGVSRGAFPRLWVTLEAVDEDEAPSGVTVLDTAP